MAPAEGELRADASDLDRYGLGGHITALLASSFSMHSSLMLLPMMFLPQGGAVVRTLTERSREIAWDPRSEVPWRC